jgi:hypothetical protein
MPPGTGVFLMGILAHTMLGRRSNKRLIFFNFFNLGINFTIT